MSLETAIAHESGALGAGSPDLSVIIVNFRTASLVYECVKSIRRTAGPLSVQVIVVDNHSQDGSAALLREFLPDDVIVEASANGGFARGNSLGLKHAVGRAILLLNPDTELFDDCLAVAMTTLESAGDIGVVGARAQLPDGQFQSTMLRFPSLRALMFAIALPSKVLRSAPWAGDTRYASRDPGRVHEVDAVSGSFMLVKRAVLQEVGALDGRFFMYGEEVEWCHRIRKAGWRIIYQPDARILHHGGASSSHMTVWKAREMMRGQLLYFSIVHGVRRARVAALLMLLRDFVRLPFAAALALVRPGNARLAAILARLGLGLTSLVSPPRGQRAPIDGAAQ
jgi:GT2 family glycosyltransferase